MAEAVIAIRALDLTRQAFLSVQQSLAKMQAAIGKAGVAIGGFLSLQLAKRALMGFNKALRDVEQDAEKFGATQEELDKVTRATGAMDSVMQSLKMGLVNVVDATLRLKDSLFGVTKADSASIADKIRAKEDAPKIKELTKDIEELRAEFAAIGETPAQHFARLGAEIVKVNKAAKEPNMSERLSALEKEKESIRLATEQKKIATKIEEDYTKSARAAIEAAQEFADKQLTEEERQINLASAIQRTINEIETLQATLPKVFFPEFATPQQLANMERITELRGDYVRLLGKHEILETSIQKISKQSGEIIAQSFEDAIFAGQRLSEVLRALAQDLLRMAFREAVTAPLGTGLGSFFKNLFRAEGGPVGAGNPYIVGERGPELFVPRSSGSIVSNDNLSGATMGGGAINITYNIASGVSRAELAPILETERKRLKAEIPDMVRRGGAYRAAFA